MEQKIFEIIMDENFPNRYQNNVPGWSESSKQHRWGKKATSKYYHIYSNQRKQKRKS